MQAVPGKSYRAEINVTPLVDVVLVLLIIFMVVTPMLQKGRPVRLPEAREVSRGERSAREVFVTVTLDQSVFFGDEPVGQNGLEAVVRERLAREPALELFIKADRGLRYGLVREVMSACRRAGARNVVLATEERKG